MQRRGLACFADAVNWLDEHAIVEVPTRLHDRATGDDGAPRLSDTFVQWLSRDEPTDKPWAFATVDATREVVCPRQHPIRRKDEARCELCDDALSWKTTSPVYLRPFMAAMARLENVRPSAPTWPGPAALVRALIRAEYRLPLAAAIVGHHLGSDDQAATVEAQFLRAIRQLHERYAIGPVPKRGISESQSTADYGGAA